MKVFPQFLLPPLVWAVLSAKPIAALPTLRMCQYHDLGNSLALTQSGT